MSTLLRLLLRWLAQANDYRLFVAFRYLLVNPRQVSNATIACLAVGFGTVGTLGLLGLWHPGALEPVSLGIDAIAAVTFAAWGYYVLRYSKLSAIVFAIGLATVGLAQLMGYLAHHNKIPFVTLEIEQSIFIQQTAGFVALGGAGLAGFAAFVGSVRSVFTFFTTVPVVGVFIGTAALVGVLAVMSGFESDLREKILGSNAHIQITREDGDFTEWRAIKARIDHTPGIVASTPYAVSEVVIAANNNGMNVIIKGIDPETVGKVTQLVQDLDDKDAMKRLAPLVDDAHDLSVPQTPPAHPGKVIDPAPADMPRPGDPIDFSAPTGDGSDATPTAPPPGHVPIVDLPQILRDGSAEMVVLPAHPSGAPALPEDTEPPAPGSAARVVDPAPPDLLTTDAPPTDFSGEDSGEEPPPAIQAVDTSLDSPISRRTQSLPGVLVGRELVKQTHLYTGEEVRVVSPLSDPSNPDATGTPIPFHRDYRVAGTFYTGMYEYDLKYVYVSLDSLDEFLDRGDAVDGIEVRIGDPDDTDAYVEKLSDDLGPQYRVQDWKELNRSLFSALKLEKIAMFLVLGIVILVASFSIVGNLIMVVVEKQREIALLKTLGASDGGLMQLFAIQGLLIGLLGTGLGIGVGLIGCYFGKRFGIPLNPDVYYIDRMPVNVELQSVVLTGLAGVLISIAATFYPSMLAARVRPAAGMRQ